MMQSIRMKDLTPGNIFTYEMILHDRKAYIVDGVDTDRVHITNRDDYFDSEWVSISNVHVYLLGNY